MKKYDGTQKRKAPRRTLIVDIPLLDSSGSVIARAADFSPDGVQIYSNKLKFQLGETYTFWIDFPEDEDDAQKTLVINLKIVWVAPDAKKGWLKAGALYDMLDAGTRLVLLDEVEKFSTGIYLT